MKRGSLEIKDDILFWKVFGNLGRGLIKIVVGSGIVVIWMIFFLIFVLIFFRLGLLENCIEKRKRMILIGLELNEDYFKENDLLLNNKVMIDFFRKYLISSREK